MWLYLDRFHLSKQFLKRTLLSPLGGQQGMPRVRASHEIDLEVYTFHQISSNQMFGASLDFSRETDNLTNCMQFEKYAGHYKVQSTQTNLSRHL